MEISTANQIHNGGRKLQKTPTLRKKTHIAASRIGSHSIPELAADRDGTILSTHPSHERAAWHNSQKQLQKQVGQHQYARIVRNRRHWQNDIQYTNEHNNGRPLARQYGKRAIGSPMKENKITRRDGLIGDNRMDTSPTPPPRAYRRERHKSPPYRNDEPPPQRQQETTDGRHTQNSIKHQDVMARSLKWESESPLQSSEWDAPS